MWQTNQCFFPYPQSIHHFHSFIYTFYHIIYFWWFWKWIYVRRGKTVALTCQPPKIGHISRKRRSQKFSGNSVLWSILFSYISILYFLQHHYYSNTKRNNLKNCYLQSAACIWFQVVSPKFSISEYQLSLTGLWTENDRKWTGSLSF